MLGKGGDKRLNSGRTGVTASLVLSLYSLCSAAIPVVFAYRSSFRWPICLVESFALLFFVFALHWKEGQVYMGGIL